jgi:hypothetical protein
MTITKRKIWFKKKTKSKTPKQKASDAMSRYVRLRDAITFCKNRKIDLSQFTRPEDIFGQCCTCPKIKSWIRMDAGHWIGRGLGGGSGVYFDERNVDLQCKICNGFDGEQQIRHERYIVNKRGQKVVDELKRKHHITPNFSDFAMQVTEQMYKDKYQKLLKENGF